MLSHSVKTPLEDFRMEALNVCAPSKPVIIEPSDALLYMLQKTYDGYNLCIDTLDSSTKECADRIRTLKKKCETF